MGRMVAGMTGVAFALAGGVVLVSGVWWPLPVAVFLFWGPITAVICESIARGNPLVQAEQPPAEATREPRKVVWLPATAGVIGLSILAAGIGVYVFGVPFGRTFGYAAMVIAGAMSINAIVVEVEDNAPGGWLRPDTWDDRQKLDSPATDGALRWSSDAVEQGDEADEAFGGDRPDRSRRRMPAPSHF